MFAEGAAGTLAACRSTEAATLKSSNLAKVSQ
jgi:hypothetical protein